MKRICVALVTATALASGTWMVHAAPPTVTPSPGYDARLRDSRVAPTVVEPAAPVTRPASRRHARRNHAGTH